MERRLKKIENKLKPVQKELDKIEVRIFGITNKERREPGVEYTRFYDKQYPDIELYREKEPAEVIKIDHGTQ
jgi:hypothetical protein